MSEKYAEILREQHRTLKTATALMETAEKLIEISDNLSAIACQIAKERPSAATEDRS